MEEKEKERECRERKGGVRLTDRIPLVPAPYPLPRVSGDDLQKVDAHPGNDHVVVDSDAHRHKRHCPADT